MSLILDWSCRIVLYRDNPVNQVRAITSLRVLMLLIANEMGHRANIQPFPPHEVEFREFLAPKVGVGPLLFSNSTTRGIDCRTSIASVNVH